MSTRRWERIVTHPGLKKSRLIHASSLITLSVLADSQLREWEEQYQRRQTRDRAAEARLQEVRQRHAEGQRLDYERELNKQHAADLTEEAKMATASLESILRTALSTKQGVDWEALKDTSHYPEPAPTAPPPAQLALFPTRKMPDMSEPRFQANLSIADRLSARRTAAKQEEAHASYRAAFAEWQAEVAKIEAINRERQTAYFADAKAEEAKHRDVLAKWQEAKLEFYSEQSESNSRIDSIQKAYQKKDPDALKLFCEIVLSHSRYPDNFPDHLEATYIADSGILHLEFQLLAPTDLPPLKEVKFVQARKTFDEVMHTKSRLNELYDGAVYQTTLRTLYEVFKADTAGVIEAIAFNGWVKTIDPATGATIQPCIVSVLARREEFKAINLSQVDAKECFKKLKGVGSSKLHSITPVAPILNLNLNDKRFVAGRAVVESITQGTNLAAMPWEDFEHLVRELFEAELSSAGGEVKVTQASRDGGVDAIAFDPDPIRGGKIIIQAKRYTNTVGVSAVRDLYGTVIKEGATKGILVTTSDYGPDSYEFARDKPITLLTGGHLLSLLAQHGHKARIDIAEARKFQVHDKD